MKKLLFLPLSAVTFFVYLFIPKCVAAGEAILCAGGINTAIGCLPVFERQALAEFILGWGVGLGSGIAFLLVIYAGFLIMTSQGNPQRLQSGKELLGAALSGLFLIIFSAFLLRIIGVNIFGVFT